MRTKNATVHTSKERFIGAAQFGRLVEMAQAAKRPATRAKYRKLAQISAMEVVARWQFLFTGNVGLPFNEDYDLIRQAKGVLATAGRMRIPAFPLAPTDYLKTAGQLYKLIPAERRQRDPEKFPAPADPSEKKIWGVGALGGVPHPYDHPESGFRSSGTFWDRADQAGGGLGYGPTIFEAWLDELERRVYFAADPLADRRIRALFVGYIAHRAGRNWKQLQAQGVWQGTYLPIPVLAWWLRCWLRTIDNGVEMTSFASAERREQAIEFGLQAIAAEGGWPQYADPFASMNDSRVSVIFDGELVELTLFFGGMLGTAEETATRLGSQLDELFEAAAAELRRFGFNPKPVPVPPALFGEEPNS